MTKKLIAIILMTAILFACGMTLAEGTNQDPPPAAPTAEAETYTGIVRDYPNKSLWFDSHLYGGFFSAYQIMKGNGGEGFDVDAFINSEMGEKLISRIKYELCLVGGENYASEQMIDYWKLNGIIEKAYNSEDPAHEWLTFTPDYVYDEVNADKKYPVVFSYHGSGNTLFTGLNLGFVHICREKGFIVVVPENENSDGAYSVENLPKILDQMEAEGYPIDRTRIYTGGMSKGGRCSIYTAQNLPDVIAAASAHGSSNALSSEPQNGLSVNDGRDFNDVPLYLAIGEFDLGQLPIGEAVLDGLNKWAQALGVSEFTLTDNLLGLAGDKTYEEEIDGTTYTFADAVNADGVTVMKIIGVEGQPHWVTYSYANLAWDFMSQFSIVDGQRMVNR